MTEKIERSYFQTRIFDELALSEKDIKIKLYKDPSNKKTAYDADIFSEDQAGNIKILVYTLHRETIKYDHPDATPDKPNVNNNREQTFYITRLKNPVGDQKYRIPKKAGTYPFFPPSLIEKYEKKKKIKTLALTEGYFKAFKGAMHGIDIIGLSSITHYRDKKTRALHEDIIKIIKECDVENIVLLYDGDCLDLSKDAYNKNEDLYKRPNSFFSSARALQELLSDYDLKVWFSHIKTSEIEGNPKGLDDLLINQKANETAVIDDFLLFSKANQFFYKTDITRNVKKLTAYFHISTPEEFYNHNSELLQYQKFTFNGTEYRYDDISAELKIERPAAANKYFRVGDTYFENIQVPNRYGDLESAFHRRLKDTIKDDHGATFLKHIPKYAAFCNVPDHVNYQQIIHNCYNQYKEINHNPEEGDCQTTLAFIKHIFGDQYELGLDYCQLLYQKPSQILPIICLVSKENETGKTTFAKWLKMIFIDNMTIVGNAELSNDFNTSYATKLLICCDEAFIDKKLVNEKLKSLATADKIIINAKGRDHIELDFFGKFILLSNNEDNFIYASNEDVRYWIRKIPKPSQDNVNILKDLSDEIPQFLYYLNKRKLSTEQRSRMWFQPSLLETDALRQVREQSRPGIEKDVHENIREMFFSFQFEEDKIYMSTEQVNTYFFKGKQQISYIAKTLKNMHIDRYINDSGQYNNRRYKLPDLNTLSVDNTPLWTEYNLRPWEFRIRDFLTADEIKSLKNRLDL